MPGKAIHGAPGPQTTVRERHCGAAPAPVAPRPHGRAHASDRSARYSSGSRVSGCSAPRSASPSGASPSSRSHGKAATVEAGKIVCAKMMRVRAAAELDLAQQALCVHARRDVPAASPATVQARNGPSIRKRICVAAKLAHARREQTGLGEPVQQCRRRPLLDVRERFPILHVGTRAAAALPASELVGGQRHDRAAAGAHGRAVGNRARHHVLGVKTRQQNLRAQERRVGRRVALRACRAATSAPRASCQPPITVPTSIR